MANILTVCHKSYITLLRPYNSRGVIHVGVKKIKSWKTSLTLNIVVFLISAVDPALLVVRNLELNDFIFSPQTGTFDLNATWLQPSLNYSRVLWYSISYQVNEGSKHSLKTVSIAKDSSLQKVSNVTAATFLTTNLIK